MGGFLAVRCFCLCVDLVKTGYKNLVFCSDCDGAEVAVRRKVMMLLMMMMMMMALLFMPKQISAEYEMLI